MATSDDRYDPAEIESRWQRRWAEARSHEVDVDAVDRARKYYNLVEFPYPSAEGLHVGHAYTYSGADSYGRYLRMRGFDVFQPIGFDAFGIHTENYALRVGRHPKTLTAQTVYNYRRQLRALGAAWDWSREVVTSDPAYYRWTQWLFLRLFEAGLAEHKEAPVVWCPSCATVLANEQLEGDRCERCDTEIERRVMRQWFLRITAYAQDLLNGLDALDWPEAAKRVQREWIGRSDGVEVDFEVPEHGLTLSTFTTRVDTLFGVTFLAVPPEHPDLATLTRGTPRAEDILSRARGWARERVVEGGGAPRDASRGQFTGAHARHPATGAQIPVYVADYVIDAYGTGAVMGVPAHDDRDLAFARAVRLPIAEVVRPANGGGPPGEAAFVEDGVLEDSGPFSGLASQQARVAIAEWLEQHRAGRRVVRYRLRDWLISRQRYWGPPIPVVHCETCGAVPVADADLPVLLPDVENFRPTGTGSSPLATVESFVVTICPSCARPARRETDVSDTFLDSAWYFLRYPSTDVDDRPWDVARTDRMLPVDSYAGGPEHVMRHHLYARFVTRALHDLGLLGFTEPFPRLRLHGMLTKDGAKMSKRRGNVVNPDELIARHGADATRMYLLFIGPWDQGGDFSDAGISGIARFLGRLWRAAAEVRPTGSGNVDLGPLDVAVAAVGQDLEHMHFNTAIARLMEVLRWARAARPAMSEPQWRETLRTIVLLAAPLAPHIAEELWQGLRGGGSVHSQQWPASGSAGSHPAEVTIAVQVNGRTRAVLTVPAGLEERAALSRALASANVQRHLDGGRPRRVFYVPDRLINLVL